MSGEGGSHHCGISVSLLLTCDPSAVCHAEAVQSALSYSSVGIPLHTGVDSVSKGRNEFKSFLCHHIGPLHHTNNVRVLSAKSLIGKILELFHGLSAH